MARSTVQNGGILRDDLVLNLDASNRGSYPGSGNIWFDISGNANHFNLQNNPTSNGTKLSFNTIPGSNQSATCQNTTCGDFGSSSFTVEMVIELPATQGGPYMALIRNRGLITYSSYAPGWAVGIVNQATFADSGPNTNDSQHLFNFSTDQPNAGAVSYHTYTIKRSNTNPNQVTASLWKNGNVQRTIQYLMLGDGLINGPTALSLMIPQTGIYATGSFYTIKLYNRDLSTTEIQSNYNIYRRVYGF
jgi:hypothetical protein